MINAETSVCPYCGMRNEHSFPLGEHPGTIGAPKPGDMMICAVCVQPSVYLSDGTMRPLTAGENTDQVRRAVGHVESMKFGMLR